MVVSFLFAFAGASSISHAADDEETELVYRPNASPYRVKTGLELALVGAGAAVTATPQLYVAESPGPWCGLQCDPDNLNPLDRMAVDLDSQQAADISDALWYSSMGLPFLFDSIDVATSDPADGWRGYWVDSLVIMETLALNFYVQNVMVFVVRRPRPYVYNGSVSEDFRMTSDAAHSFYSGHTASAFAAATAYSRLFMLRHPNSPLIVPVWVFTNALAATTGTLRVMSGSHFPSDVVVGAAAGVFMGAVIPWLHELPGDKGRAANGMRVRPYFSMASAGVTGSF